MNFLGERHPFVIVLYYMTALAALLVFGHPDLNLTAFLLLFADRMFQRGIRKSLRSLLYSMGAAALCLVINPLCNHRGVTLLFMAGEMRITKEAVYYGGHMALLLLASLFLFACFSESMTAEKIMTLTGNRLPSFSLLFTMILRTVPKVRREYESMTMCCGHRPKVWSALLDVVLEDAVERSIAMKQKLYGRQKRSHFYKREWNWQDFVLCGCIVGVIVWMGSQVAAGIPAVRYVPGIKIERLSLWTYGVLGIYFGIPILLRGKEEGKWFLWKRKITDSVIRNRKNQPCT